MADERNEQTSRPGTRITEDDRNLSRQRDRERDTIEASPGRVQAEPRERNERAPQEDDFSDPATQREIDRLAREI